VLNLSSYPEPTREPTTAQPALQPPRWAVAARAELVDTVPARFVAPIRQLGQTRSFVAALGSVREGLSQGDRLIVVTGASGTGKTMLCRALIEEAELLTHTSVMLQPPATPEDLLAHFLRDVGVLDNGTSSMLMTRNSLIFALQRFLESLIPVGGRAVLVIDEAQHLTPMVLEQLRLALNFETDQSALLQVVLVGQPELDSLLQWPELQRVAQRVSRRCELTGIEPDEFPAFLDECLQRRAPGSLIRFMPPAERAVVMLSRGVPRVADRLSSHALELAASENAYRIEPRMVTASAKRIGLGTRESKQFNRMGMTGAAAIAACAIAVGGAWGWATRSSESNGRQVSGRAGGVAGPAAAAAVPPAAGLTTGALETAGGLTVTVASFRTESRARAVVAQLVDQGFPAFARSQSDGGPYQVIVGPYVSAEEAVAAQKALAAQGAAGTAVRIESADLSRPAWR
jgi:type II secretory pathway predicted ATPase ExeA